MPSLPKGSVKISSDNKKYPDGRWHPTVTVDGVEGCGHSWCTGDCGLPALVAVDGQKVYGSMVAVGKVLQPFRVEWSGSIHALTTEQSHDLDKRWWW